MMLRAGDEPIPGYKLQKFLGKGQFGEVWKTTAPGKTNAALKFLDLSGKQGWKEFRGIQHVKRIRHANLMPITALWLLDDNGNVLSDDAIDNMVTDSTTGSVTETAIPTATVSESVVPRLLVVANLLGEKNLLEEMKEHKENGSQGIPVELLLNYMEDAAKGIDFLNSPKHNLGQGRVAVQHCDIKPENILLVGDSVMVCDFGVARVLEAGISATATGMVGSPAYMAPECIDQKPSLASDQYSLALSYAELRQGDLPFSDKTYPGVIKAHQTSTFDFAGIPEPERQVLKKATAKKPADRFETSIEMVRALRRAVEGEVSGKHSSSKPMVLATMVIATVAICICVYLMTRPEPVADGGNQTPPVVETVKDLEIHFSVAINKILIDGKSVDVDSETLALQRKESEEIHVRLNDSEQFYNIDKTIPVASFVDGKIQIEVREKGSYHSNQAEQFFAEGKFDQAVNSLSKALTTADGTDYAKIPESRLLLQKFSDAQMQLIDSGKKLAVGSLGGEFVVFDLLAKELSNQPLMRGDFGQETLAISLSDSHYAFRKSDTEIIVQDFQGQSNSRTLDVEGDIFELHLSPNGRWLMGRAMEAVSSGVAVPDEIAPQVWDLSTDSPKGAAFVDQLGEWTAFYWSPDNRYLAGTIDLDEEDMRIWSFQNGKPEQHFAANFVGGVIACVAFSPDSEMVAFAGKGSLDEPAPESQQVSEQSDDNRATIYDLRSQSALSMSSGHEGVIQSIDLTDRRLATGDSAGNIQVWEQEAGSDSDAINNWQQVGNQKIANINVEHLKFINHGEHMISATKTQILIHRTNALDYSIPIAQDDILIKSIAVGADDRWLVALDQKGNVFVWDLQRCLLLYEACYQSGKSFYFERHSNPVEDNENISLLRSGPNSYQPLPLGVRLRNG